MSLGHSIGGLPMKSASTSGIERRLAIALIVALAGASPAAAQLGVEVLEESAWLDSGMTDNFGEEFLPIDVGTLHVPDAQWIRVHFGEYDLGSGSYLTISSLLDGDYQIFDTQMLAYWYDWSGMFRGDEVQITLNVAPGDTDVFVRIDAVRTPIMPVGGEPDMTRSICGANDDRVAGGHTVVGRMTNSGCTGWLVSNGAMLSAGHCPVSPGDIIEFNVPASTANGNPVAATAANQYPINAASVTFENGGVGQDWLVAGLNPNATTGLRAHIVQGFLHMTKTVPANGTQVRVTGYGIDNSPAGTGGMGANCCDPDGTGALPCGFNCNSASQTLQTHAGGLVSSSTNLLTYTVDTMPANSGSPVIWNANGLTIGIHTAGGCTSTGGANNGTRFSRAALETAIWNLPGPNARYVDSLNVGLPSTGGVFEPFHTVTQAVNVVPDGGTVVIVAGSYSAASGNTFTAGADGRAMTFVAPVGTVVIGN